jgi:hypothetical protein
VALPVAPDALTPAFLTSALRDAGALPGNASVRAFTHERLGEGVGFIGVVARLMLTYGGDEAGPRSVIAKFPSPEEGARSIGNLYGLYEREVRFYREVASRSRLNCARCYLAEWDAAAGQSLLLLEDLSEHGSVGDQLAGCSPAEASLALGHLARFHAAWWANPEMSSLPWLERGTDLVRASMTRVYEDSRAPFLDAFGARLAPEVRACVDGLNERVLAAMDAFDARAEYTIAHGDFRIDNLFFGSEGGPYELAVIDWQSPNRGWGAYDLAYFMSGSMPPEQRRAGERAALERYYETLTAGGVRGYRFEDLLSDYRASLMVYLAIFVVNGATLERSNERAVQLFDVIFDRLNSAIVDHQALDAI